MAFPSPRPRASCTAANQRPGRFCIAPERRSVRLTAGGSLVTDPLPAAMGDSVLRRLDVSATPDDAFVRSSASVLVLHAARARARDRSVVGRLQRDLRAAFAGGLPIRRTVALAALMLIASLLLVGLLLSVAGSRPQLPPLFGLAGNGRIAFVNGYHIFTSDPSGADIRQLTFGDGGETEPRFSPDGTRVSYKQWHPAANGVDPSARDAVVAAADGSNPVVVAPAVLEMSHIAWSPDSKSIAFSGSLDNGQTSTGYVAAADGSGTPTSIGTFEGSAWDPTWSPDGQRLVIVADAGMFVVGRDGRNATLVTHTIYKEIGSRGEAAEWSPDGTQILFTAITVTDQQDVYLLTLDGSPERIISGDTPRARDATFSPDGKSIAYMRQGTGLGPLCVITDRTGRALRVLPGAYGWYQPIWSPDGTKVVVTDDRPGPDNDGALPAVRVILDVAGSEPPIEIVTPGASGESIPDWAATWQRIAP